LAQESTCLHVALEKNHLAAAERFMDTGADLKAKDVVRLQPLLHLRCTSHHALPANGAQMQPEHTIL
jgi:hypothetical protein